jgi:tol-pal system protein YbgF
MKKIATISLLLIGLAPGLSMAEERLSDIVLQMQRLQQEMQRLRGQVEVQQHQIDTLKKQVQDQYLDLDSRLRGQGPAAPPEAAAQPAPSEPTPIAPAAPEAAAPDLSISGSSAVQLPPEKDAYRAAFDLLKERRYDEAIKAFEDLLTVYPNGEYADNTRYWLGETYYVKRDYANSLTAFQGVLTNYPLSPKVPGAMLKVGYIHYDQGDWQNARSSFQDLIGKFPDSTEARLAQSRLERMTKEGR